MDKLLTFLIAFFISVAIMPLIVFLTKKLKVRQTVLHYVTEHKAKSGTPTMGGIGFIVPLAVCLIFAKGDKLQLYITIAVTSGYGIVGFLDDFIKVFFRRNEGLSAWQKIVFQLALAIIVAFFAYNSMGGAIYTVALKEIDLKAFAVPLFVLIFLAFTNSVNLTDGLDGLAGGVTVVYLAVFAFILFLFDNSGGANSNLILFCLSLIGGIVGFLCFNSFPAKIFMGDTGSMALGGALATLAIFSRRALIVPFLGAMYVMTALSVIIQVAYFKRTKKRVFLMSPIHHHFQQKGIHESKIVFVYCVITAVIGIIILTVFTAI